MNAGFIVLFFHDDFCSFTDEKGPFFDEKTMSFLICFLLLKKILICTKVVEERVAVLIQGYNDRVLERGQIRKSPGVD